MRIVCKIPPDKVPVKGDEPLEHFLNDLSILELDTLIESGSLKKKERELAVVIANKKAGFKRFNYTK